jgi:hypothetical protein
MSTPPRPARKESPSFLAVACILALVAACGGSTTEPEGPVSENPTNPVDPGATTPSSVPVGDYPPIPLPTNAGGTTRTQSDTVTTIAPLATDFRPAILGLTGDAWSVGQADGGPGPNLPIRTCFNTVFEGTAASSAILYVHKYVECPLLEGGAFWYVRYPDRGAYIDTWLQQRLDAEASDAGDAYRPHLVEGGSIKQPEARTTLFTEHEIGWYRGDMDIAVIGLGRDGCALRGTIAPGIPCQWRNITSASVKRRPLTNPVFLRKDIFWEKAGNSEIFPNFQAGANNHSFSRSWTVGTEDEQTTQFGRTVSAELGLEYQGLSGKVGTTLSQTFGTSVSVTTTESREETFQMVIAGGTTAVFEIWNLTEQYTFVNEDGTPYADPNYVFALTDLTRKATIATARTTVEFAND